MRYCACAHRRINVFACRICPSALSKCKNFYEAAKAFVDAYEKCEHSEDGERELPQLGELYRDVFGNEYLVVSVLSKEILDGTPLVVLPDIKAQAIFTLPLEDFFNPTFTKE